MHIDGVLAYDSRLEDYDLLTLKTTTGLNKGGAATIGLPPGHPAYGSFKPYKSIVEIYRDEKLKFRGRPLPPSDDFNNNRTVVCEGELCFLRDAQHRPYLYQDTPANIFTAVLGVYNGQADAEKQFKVGTITVTDANDYVRLESEEAENVLAVVNKLLDRCGGYVVFTTDSDGARVVNWYAELGYRSSQVIEFGENLLDFARDSSTNEELATALLPYGAKDSETGLRVTIESVNGGSDYIVDEEARQLRGFILATKTWDDVTEPANLLRKAQEWLTVNRNLITSLKLSALDLSIFDKNLDSYEVGDKIPVLSKPHKVDEDFMLTEKEEDHLNPGDSGSITLGKDKRTLTSADVAGDDKSSSELHKVKHEVKAEYTANIAKAVQTTEETLATLIQQTSESILLEVSQTYTTNDQLTAAVSSSMTQFADQFLFEFEKLQATVDANDSDSRTLFEEIYSYISFEGGDIKLGNSESAITLTVENDRISFKKNGQEFGWWDGVNFHTGNIVVEVNERAQFGAFAFLPRSNDSLDFLKVN
jgi:hypothetical protein